MGEIVSGGCKCGQLGYQGALAEVPMFRCYCRDCQQLTGTGHSDMVPLLRDGFEVTGEMKVFEMKGGSGKSTFSGFCPDCGSQIMRRSVRSSERVYVHAASLEDPAIYQPKLFIYKESAQPWDMPED